MKLTFLVIVTAIFYVADASESNFVNFVGEDREFRCEGKSVTWHLHNGTKISQKDAKHTIEDKSNESVLTIKNISLRDVGTYTCKSDKTDKPFILKTFYPQTIEQSETSVVVNENGEATFRCKSFGVPAAVSYFWYHGDNRLSPSSETLTLKDINKDQAGEYFCVVDQQLRTYRNVQQKKFELIVKDQNSTHLAPVSMLARENEAISLSCRANNSSPSNYSWSFEDVEMVDEKKAQIVSTSLNLKNIQPNHAGKYTCKNIETSQTREFLLNVDYAPIFQISSPVSVHGRIGEKVKLECSVNSFSIPTFRWISHTGYEIFENIDTFNKMSRLTIELKSLEDLKKTYKCLATNEIARRELEFKLNEQSNGSNMKNVSMFAFILSAFLLAV